MATTLTVNTLRNSVGWNFEETQTFGNSFNSNSFTYSKTATNGTGADQANIIYVYEDDTGIGTSSSVTVDLQSITDMFGNSVTMTGVKAIYVENASTNSGANIVMGAAASNQWGAATALISTTTATILIPNGACLQAINTNSSTGWVVDATHKDLKFANASGSYALPWKLVIIGRSA